MKIGKDLVSQPFCLSYLVLYTDGFRTVCHRPANLLSNAAQY